MPKILPAPIILQIDAQQKRPVYLFEVELSSTLRFANYKTNIVFPTGGNVYIAKAVSISNVNQAIDGGVERVTIKFDNISGDMAAYANIESFRGKRLIVKRIFLDELTMTDHFVEVFSGYMESPSSVNFRWLSVTATNGNPLSRKCLKSAYQRMCPWIFGGEECNTDGLADLAVLTAAGTADSGACDYFIDNALTQLDHFWDYGRVEIIKNSVVYYRKVKTFVAATNTIELDVDLPITVDNTCTYVLYKGCDQTWDTCNSVNNWGPAIDNSLNFGGCLHISKRQRADADADADADIYPLLQGDPAYYDAPWY